MDWFRHKCDAHLTEEMSYVLSEMGAEAYGVFWIIMEKIARYSKVNSSKNLSDSIRPSARFTVKKWSGFCEISPQKFRKIAQFLSDSVVGFEINYQGKYIEIEYKYLVATQGRSKGKR